MTRILVLGSTEWTDEDLLFDILSDYYHEQDDDEMVVMFKPEDGVAKLVIQWAKASAKFGVKHGQWAPAQRIDHIFAFVTDDIEAEKFKVVSSTLALPIQIHREGE